jgi:ribosomal protein S18 acetylase RimI-like enzyme
MEYKWIDPNRDMEMMTGVLSLYETIFGDSAGLLERMKTKYNLLILVAIYEEKVVGFKMGYELEKHKFYSWLGGVDQEYRNKGVGSTLMTMQHQILKERGYKIVQTKTKNKWKQMLILNLKHGFDIIGTYTDNKGESKIILEKKLK